MNRVLISAILGAALFASCLSSTGEQIPITPKTPDAGVAQNPYVITDHRNKASGQVIPEWVSLYLQGGVRLVETLDAYQERYVFISRNEGNNFSALNQWTRGFSAKLDFPRLAAVRIETRFGSGVPFPDQEYGAFYEELIRAASDAPWTGARRDDDFWIHKTYFPVEDEEAGPNQNQESEIWEFFILVTIDKKLFGSQLDTVFRSIELKPRPSKNQIAAAARVKERFFTGF